MRYVSVCAGIEAATVAWHHIGWTPAWFSEIEPFPSAVLAHHYPEVRNLGDMTQFEEWPDEPVDLLVGGTPCQSFSVAGLRKGLADPRGNLMLTFLAIAQRQRPRWIVWENVPGVLSSNGGRDFGTFLGALGELGYGFAYRVLDAQWFGVAQRRRRVFVVGHLGDWQRPAKVLFESESVRRDTAPSREARQSAAAGTARCFAGSRQSDIAATLETTAHDYSRADGFNMVAQPIGFGAQMSNPQTDVDLMQTLNAKNPMAVAFAQNQLGEVRVGEVTNTLNTNSNASGRNTPMVAQPIHYRKSRRAQSVNDHETWVEDAVSNTLNCFDVGDVRSTDVVAQPMTLAIRGRGDDRNLEWRQDGTANALLTPNGGRDGLGVAAVAQPIAIHPHVIGRAPTSGPQGKEYIDDGSAYCMDARGVPQSVAQPYVGGLDYENNAHTMDEPTGPLLKGSPTGGGRPLPAIATAMQVRRLTPVECERLQGFPDNYTNIPWRKKPDAPDGPRYKALGNSMAVPVMRWIGERINAIEESDT